MIIWWKYYNFVAVVLVITLMINLALIVINLSVRNAIFNVSIVMNWVAVFVILSYIWMKEILIVA